MIHRAFLAVLFTALAAAAEPNLTLVDGPGNMGQFPSIDGTIGGGVVASYYDADSGDLKFGVCTALCDRANATWTTSTVDRAGDVGRHSAVAGGAVPRIAYYDATLGALKLATCTAACTTASPFWVISIVDRGSGDTGLYPSLGSVGDSTAISYYDRTNGDLKLAVCASACSGETPTWKIITVDSAGDVGRFAVMRGDFAAEVEIAYADATNGRLKMAICKAGCASPSASWIFQDVDQLASNADMRISLALNEGAPSISYYDADNGALKLATCNTSCGTSTPQWVVSVIDNAGDAGQSSALVLNGHIPGIAYSATIRSCNGSICHEVDELRVAVCSPLPGRATSDMPCGIRTIDGDMAGLYPSIVRSGDSIYVGYYEVRGRDLKVAYMHLDEGLFDNTLNYTSLWWDPEESGWGINFSQQGDIVFGTLFTYDASGQPMWLVMSDGRKQPGRVFSGALYRTTGPAFNAQPFTPVGPGNLTQVGTMTVGFADQFAALAYTVNGVTVNKTLRRQAFAAERAPSCHDSLSTSAPGSFQDLWWNPGESGWGVNFAQQNGVLFGTLFTYDASGRGTWFVMSAGRRQADGSFAGELYRTAGAPFNATPFTPISPGQIVQVGMMQVIFSDRQNGTLTYTVNGITVTKAITRQVFSTPQSVCGGG